MKFRFSKTSLGRFRLVALLEGISYVLLLFISMPLKYYAGMPDFVKYNGWVHGLLFILYILALINVKVDQNWKFKKTTLAFIISLVPFGAFYFDKELQREENLLMADTKVQS